MSCVGLGVVAGLGENGSVGEGAMLASVLAVADATFVGGLLVPAQAASTSTHPIAASRRIEACPSRSCGRGRHAADCGLRYARVDSAGWRLERSARTRAPQGIECSRQKARPLATRNLRARAPGGATRTFGGGLRELRADSLTGKGPLPGSAPAPKGVPCRLVFLIFRLMGCAWPRRRESHGSVWPACSS